MESSVVEIRGHHLLRLCYCFLAKDRKRRIAYMVRVSEKERGEEFAKNEGDIWRKIFNDPETKIKLVVIIDDICKGCSQIQKCGTDAGNKIDKAFIRSFDCEVNEIYSLKELIRKGNGLIKDYKKALPPRRGRPKIRVVIGSKLNRYKG